MFLKKYCYLKYNNNGSEIHMINKMSNYILDNILYKDEKIDGDQREIMLFGITRIVEDIPKYIGILIISILLNILSEVGIVLAITLLYKTFIGGAHAGDNITCFLVSTVFFIFPVMIAKYIPISQVILNLVFILVFVQSIYTLIMIAPADTQEVPIINKQKRKTLKILGFVSLISIYIFMIFVLKNNEVVTIILLSMAGINIFATKIVYKIFKCKYSYESDEFKAYFNN